MASITHLIDRSTLMFFAVTALACVTKAASTAITTRLATTVLMPGRIFGLAITASAIEIFSLCILVTAVGLFLGRVSRGLLLLAWVPGAMSCLAGTVLSLITLAFTIHFADEKQLDESEDSIARDNAAAGLAIGIIGLIPQTAFYVLLWPRKEHSAVSPVEPTEEMQHPPPRTVKRRSISVHMASLGPSSPKFFRSHSEPGSPSLSAFSSPRSSFRNSSNQAPRPMTSKTRLLIHTSFSSRDSRGGQSGEPSTENMRQNDDFESWDTSAVEDNYASPFGSKTQMTRLETIPGSRPVSPAHPLDGPFAFDGMSPDQLPLPESPMQSPMSPMSPGSETSSLRSMRRPTIRRANSNANDQSFIHPLFRTESPGPPPLTSPGTVIHASPYAGQIVSPDMTLGSRLHSAHGSRPTTPNLASPTISRKGSLRSVRTNAKSPVEPPERGPSQLSSQTRYDTPDPYSPHPND